MINMKIEIPLEIKVKYNDNTTPEGLQENNLSTNFIENYL